jgi:HEAT repeat protein
MITKFQDLDTVTAKEVSAALLRNDPEELQFVSITIALSDLDHRFIQSICIQLCSSKDRRVRGNALASLGHLARRFGHLEELLIKPIIESSLQDTDEYVRMSAKSAADEIYQFLHWQISGHQYG